MTFRYLIDDDKNHERVLRVLRFIHIGIIENHRVATRDNSNSSDVYLIGYDENHENISWDSKVYFTRKVLTPTVRTTWINRLMVFIGDVGLNKRLLTFSLLYF